ncbi:MAG: hypothetical protein AAGL24_02315 [Pseudomonadota bacterium]
MVEDRPVPDPMLALNTKVEDDFVAPLTAIRGALEILRDVADLDAAERQRFVETALGGCARLETAVQHLADSVYAAGRKLHAETSGRLSDAEWDRYDARIRIDFVADLIEIDFSAFEFNSSKIVNDFYDVIDARIEATRRDWYFVVNYRACSIWPEAWVAFAHRGKKVNVTHSLGTVRFDEDPATEPSGERSDPDLFASRDEALARIAAMKAANAAGPDQRRRTAV